MCPCCILKVVSLVACAGQKVAMHLLALVLATSAGVPAVATAQNLASDSAGRAQAMIAPVYNDVIPDLRVPTANSGAQAVHTVLSTEHRLVASAPAMAGETVEKVLDCAGITPSVRSPRVMPLPVGISRVC